jgi:hypothetical protein
VYFDDADWKTAGCYDPSVLMAGAQGVDWAKYMATDACVCRKNITTLISQVALSGEA